MNREDAIKLIECLYFEEDYSLVPELADALRMAINSLQAWDEVLKELNTEAESFATFDVGVAMGLAKAIRIIEQKLKEVEE